MTSASNPDFAAGTMTTYRCANGDVIYGEYDFVMHEEFFEGTDEPTQVIQEEWFRIRSQTRMFGELEPEAPDA